jgi:DNA-entry nuclease
MMFLEKRRLKKEQERIAKEQERIRREKEEKAKNKKVLIGCACALVVCFLILGIMSLNENKASVAPSASATESTVQNVDTSNATVSNVAPAQKQETETESQDGQSTVTDDQKPVAAKITVKDIPAYDGTSAYIAINGNEPYFTDSDYTTSPFESYSDLDTLGRCGVAYANVCKETMPTEERGSIGMVKPSGWHTVKYDNVDGKYLYNRCHLIGYQLSAENANTKNLITGTRYMNVEGMLPFENMVADYIKETNHHVLYRVTPIFDGNNLLASGVLMEAKSVEDKGEGICFNVYCYNAQPGITIDYATGDSSLSVGSPASVTAAPPASVQTPNANTTSPSQTYILNTSTHKFHKPSCSSVGQMSEANKQTYTGSRDDLIAQGYEPCKRCNP